MQSTKFTYPVNKPDLYNLLIAQLYALTENIPHLISNLSNASALLGSALPEINWVGFYLIPSMLPEYFPLEKLADKKDLLILGPFQGLPACIEIAVGKGVCGTAVSKDEIILVPDVHAFPGHIACDSASNSEIVLPIHNADGKIAGVLDIDSPILGRFDEEDREGLLKFVKVLEETVF
ncbi:MAG: GAF domain-containing protein [Schaedlerella sp.]|nr:GAF domain-containing protein [Schaedlerella sp.]